MLSPSVLYARLLAKARLRHFQLIVGIADQGSIQKAAPLLNLSQPAATQALREIESLLGVPLFERHARGMKPSVYGEALVARVRSILDAVYASSETLAALQQGKGGILRIGGIPAATTGLLARMLPAFTDAYPDLRIEVVEDTGERLGTQLLAGALDLVLCRPPRDVPPGFAFRPLYHDQVIVVARPAHPLARRRSIRPSELARYKWHMPPSSLPLRQVLESHFRDWGIHAPTSTVVTSSMAILLAQLASADTLALALRALMQTYIDLGVIVALPVRIDAAFEPLGLLQQAQPTDPIAARFVSFLVERLGKNGV